MLFLIGFIVGALALQTPTYQECKKINFKGDACKVSKSLHDLE
jgi:hypothetical protein